MSRVMAGPVLQTVLILERGEDGHMLKTSHIEARLLILLPTDSALIRWAITQMSDIAYRVDVSYQLKCEVV
jgi:hypothetical protein